MISAAARTLDASDPDDDDLPGRIEPRLEIDLPPSLNYKHYRTIPLTEGRYVVNVAGGVPQVYDLEANRALCPNIVKGGRLRFRIAYGPNKSVKRVLLSRLVLQATQGPPQYYRNRKTAHQGHHSDKNRTNDHASNLSWEVPTQHARIERNRPKSAEPDKRMATQKYGEENSRLKSKKTRNKITLTDIETIIKRRHEGWSVLTLARDFRTTPTTIYRLIHAQTRLREVAAAYALNDLRAPQHAIDFAIWGK